MVNVETVFKGRIFMARNLYKILDKRVFGDCKRLSNNNVVSFRKQRKGELNKIETACLVDLIDAKQIDDYCIGCSVGYLRQFPVL
jgi:hypothetical protein